MHIPEDEDERRRLNERGREILRRKNGAVRPHREDGYVNLLNKYGTKQDNSEAYKFEREPVIPDMQLTGLYEGNGLFSKIIDTPAEEALKHGFDLNLKSDELNAFVEDALDDLEWEEKAATAIKWARLYGGALIVMLIDDGRGLEEPVDWEHIRSIDELRVYERSIVQPDYASLYQQDYGGKGLGTGCPSSDNRNITMFPASTVPSRSMRADVWCSATAFCRSRPPMQPTCSGVCLNTSAFAGRCGKP